jgi:N-acetylglucosaminyldiphosphoundecaprenol N-acetyl-beta-D-mannosaminyltransferase
MLANFKIFDKNLNSLGPEKQLITTINAHSYNVTKSDDLFKDSLMKSDVLIPDGVSVVWAVKWLTGKSLKKIAGADLFFYEMDRLNGSNGKCFFLGSTDQTLLKIKENASKQYPNVNLETFSPPYKPEFSAEDNAEMVKAVNNFNPDVLFIGLTAPKQEKWAYQNFDKLNVGHIGCIGAVFDFYAGNIDRAPQWMIRLGLEWFYRLMKEPRRLWKRYLIGNLKFLIYVLVEKIVKK